jgi:uncharacterized membrane protein YjjB (DUF3815 family)
MKVHLKAKPRLATILAAIAIAVVGGALSRDFRILGVVLLVAGMGWLVANFITVEE